LLPLLLAVVIIGRGNAAHNAHIFYRDAGPVVFDGTVQNVENGGIVKHYAPHFLQNLKAVWGVDTV
ncbi:MAG: hypothetical protein DRQ02_12660, partial [Candidatus Latescibacterota bacterium]